jgi:hypothetical protein
MGNHVKYSAVVFDLFGTMINISSHREYEKISSGAAAIHLAVK